MPPKSRDGSKGGSKAMKGKKFYLIWWAPVRDDAGNIICESSVSVVKREKLDAKNRVVGREARLPWKVDGTTKFHDAKVVAESDNEDQLDELEVEALTGNLKRPQDKAYSSLVLTSLKSKAKSKREANKESRARTAEDACEIMKELPITMTPNSLRAQTTAARAEPPVSASSGALAVAARAPVVAHDFICHQIKGDIVRALSSTISQDKLVFLEKIVCVLEKYSNASQCGAEMAQVMSTSLKGLEMALNDNIANGDVPPINLQLPDDFFQPGVHKSPLVEGYDLHVPSHVKLQVSWRLKSATKWEDAVTEILTGIYEDNVKWLTALGTHGTTGVDKQLHKFLYEYSKEKFFPELNKKILNNHINRLCGNRKRKILRRKSGEGDAKKTRGPSKDQSQSGTSATFIEPRSPFPQIIGGDLNSTPLNALDKSPAPGTIIQHQALQNSSSQGSCSPNTPHVSGNYTVMLPSTNMPNMRETLSSPVPQIPSSSLSYMPNGDFSSGQRSNETFSRSYSGGFPHHHFPGYQQGSLV